MGKPLQIITIALALAISIATVIQTIMANATSDVSCVRKSHSTLSFTSVEACDRGVPKQIYLWRPMAQQTDRGGLKFGDESWYYVRDGKSYWLAKGSVWEMLPDGRLFGFFPQRSGYVQIEPQRYQCNATAAEILAMQ